MRSHIVRIDSLCTWSHRAGPGRSGSGASRDPLVAPRSTPSIWPPASGCWRRGLIVSPG